MAVVAGNWYRYSVRITSVAVDPAGFDHRYDLYGYAVVGMGVNRSGVAPFRRLFPPPIRLTAASVGEEGVLAIGPDGVERFSLDTPEGVTPKACTP